MRKARIFLSGLSLIVMCFGLVFAQAANAAETAAAPKKVAQKKEVVYVASKGSDKYHVAGCSAATAIKPENKVIFKSKAEAEKVGYKPCGLCIKK
jgi:hypothetical protein